MARSGHVAEIRALVGTHPLLLPSVGTAVFDEARSGGPREETRSGGPREETRLLLVRHADGTHRWGLPGGAVEPGEHPADAAVREVHEETGLEVEIIGLAGVFGGPDAGIRYDNGDRTDYVTTVFLARPRAGVPAGPLSVARDELRDADWFPLDELDAVDIPPHPARMIAAAVHVHRDGAAAQFEPPTWQATDDTDQAGS